MVTHWGMSERLGPVAFRDSEDHPFLGREMAEPRRFSEHTAQVIDEEVSRLLREAADKATAMIRQNRDKLDALAKRLEEIETLDEEEIEKLIGASIYKQAGDAAEIASYRSEGSHAMMIAHNVYFTLHDNSPAAVQAMIDDCHRYLAHLPGIVFYAAGTPLDADRSRATAATTWRCTWSFRTVPRWTPT